MRQSGKANAFESPGARASADGEREFGDRIRKLPSRCPECSAKIGRLTHVLKTKAESRAKMVIWSIGGALALALVVYQVVTSDKVYIFVPLFPLIFAGFVSFALPFKKIGVVQCSCGWRATVMLKK
jgi:hypothetical protein